jgi:hypothetical protein
MGRKKIVVGIIIIVLLSSMLLGCSAEGVEDIKGNANISKEYNDTIAVYNKLALSFTDLAKLVDKEINEPSGFDDDFWKDYAKKEKKVLERKEKMENFQFQHQEIATIMEEIVPFMNHLEKYLEAAKAFEADGSKENFDNIHKEIYDEMMKQSTRIVKIFDNIHAEYVVTKK